jgi:acetylornithine/N-succinyldiaminopimelate aminotransferase
MRFEGKYIMEKISNSLIFDQGKQYLMNTYSRMPVVFKKAYMQYLWDIEGKRYLDFIAGYGCLNVGHSNKYVIGALLKQIPLIIQPSNLYYNLPQVRLAEKICRISRFGQKVFFANSGTESIEAAIKLARKYSTDKYGNKRIEIITFNRSFHGRTMGALSATAQEKKQKKFEPLLKGFIYSEFNNIESLKNLINENTCAIMLEPVQGEGGIYPADKNFMEYLRDVCSKNDILLIFDEVQTGFGRTGRMFAYENYDVKPDILVLAKSLGGGMPIGAIISTDNISSSFAPGMHGSTFGGNAASCTAGIAVIDYLLDNNIPEKVNRLGEYFISELRKIQNSYSIIKEVRGIGLMAAMEYSEPVTSRIVGDALNDGIILNRVSDNTLRFLPPLIITKANIDRVIRWLDRESRIIENENKKD